MMIGDRIKQGTILFLPESKEKHSCDPPDIDALRLPVGMVWRCDCGRTYRAAPTTWDVPQMNWEFLVWRSLWGRINWNLEGK